MVITFFGLILVLVVLILMFASFVGVVAAGCVWFDLLGFASVGCIVLVG